MELDNTQPRLSDYVRPLLARKLLILLIVILATGGVYAYSAHHRNVYSTATLVFVKDPGDPVTGVSSPQSTDRNVQNEASLLYSRDTAAVVAKQIAWRRSDQDLLNRVSITSKPGQDFVQVAATGDSPQQAARIANSFAQQFVTLINGSVLLRIKSAIALTKNQLGQLPPGQASLTQRSVLVDQLNRLELALNVPTTTARQIDSALPPASPSSPKPKKDALFAFILSLVFAIATAYGIERFDRRLKHPEEMDRAYGAPLLAVLPHADAPAPLQGNSIVFGKEFREPFRVLRTNLELAAIDAPPRTIVVSSAMPGEGKSTVTRNLALAFRESGKSVAVVDLDLRHPTLAPLFGVLPGGPGVTEIMRGEVTFADAVHPVPAGVVNLDELLDASGRNAVGKTKSDGRSPRNGNGNGNGHGHGHSTSVDLILGGARPANPPAVLASGRLAEVLDELRGTYDIVIIDSAPVLAVTDTVPLLRYADAALFVGRLGVTTRDTARRLTDFLARVPDVNLLGIVANDLQRLEASSYGYGYGYAGVYGSEDVASAAPARAERGVEEAAPDAARKRRGRRTEKV